MALKPLRRAYNMSDASLLENTNNILQFATRDLTELAPFGYDAPRIAAIQAKADAFFAFPKDEFYSASISVAVAERNTAMQVVTDDAEGILRRAVQKFGADSPKIKLFGFEGYNGLRDQEKLLVAKQVHTVAASMLTDLSTEGLTAPILAQIDTNITNAGAKALAKNMAVSLRDSKVNERITLANDMYSDIVKLADTGKHVWEDTNEAFYNDYVLYPGQGAGANVSEITVPAGQLGLPSVVIDAASDSVEITIISGAAIVVGFAATPGDAMENTFTVNNGTPYSNRADASGWTSARNRCILQNNTAGDVRVRVVVRDEE